MLTKIKDVRDQLRRELLWRRHGRELDRLTRDHPLRYLFLEVTRRCNLSCVYCGSSCARDAASRELDVDEWLDVVRQIAGDFDPTGIMVAVTGGEPLFKRGVVRLFHELRRLGFAYGIVSNGFLITPGLARRLVDAGIGSISLSMDAPPALNDELRGAGASAAVERAIINLRQAGFRGTLEIISTITRPAVTQLEAMRRHVAGLRVPRWRVAPVMPIGRALDHPELLPGPAEVRRILEFVYRARRDDYTPRPEHSEEGYLGNRYESHVRPYLCQCRSGITIAGILRDGRIGACPELGDAFVQGDIKQERFRDVWENRYHNLRDRSWTRRGICGDCDAYRRCGGGSMHLYEDTEAPLTRCLYQMARAAERC